MLKYQTYKKLAILPWVCFNFCDKLFIMLYLCTTLKLLAYVLFSGNVDNDVVLISTVVEDGAWVFKLHTEIDPNIEPYMECH